MLSYSYHKSRMALTLVSVLFLAAASVQNCSGFTSPHSIPLFIPRSKLCAAKSKTDNKEDTLQEGRLVEFTSGTGKGSNKQITLGAIIGRDGKKNLKILNSSGRTSSVPVRSIKHMVPNARNVLDQVQIQQHEMAAATALEKDVAAGMLLYRCNFIVVIILLLYSCNCIVVIVVV